MRRGHASFALIKDARSRIMEMACVPSGKMESGQTNKTIRTDKIGRILPQNNDLGGKYQKKAKYSNKLLI